MVQIPLSYSRYNTYEQCPLQFMHKFVEKTYPKDDDNPAFIKGNKKHKTMEDSVNLLLKGKPHGHPTVAEADSSNKDTAQALELVQDLIPKFQVVKTELQVAVDENWKKCSWFDNSVAYYRCVLDLTLLNPLFSLVIDYKTGKVREYSGWGGQLHLAACIMLGLFEEMKSTTCTYLYMEHKQMIPVKLTQDDLPRLRDHFNELSLKINSDNTFNPTPNQYCNWCKLTPKECKFKN